MESIDYEQCIMEDNDENGEFYLSWKKYFDDKKKGKKGGEL